MKIEYRIIVPNHQKKCDEVTVQTTPCDEDISLDSLVEIHQELQKQASFRSPDAVVNIALVQD
jgi:hypothetical protein